MDPEEINKAYAPYNWEYLTDQFIASPGTFKDDLLSKVINDEDDESISTLLYEILLNVSEYSQRVSPTLLKQLLTELLMKFNTQADKLKEISELFIILSQSFPNSKNLSTFLKECNIDKKIKILYIDKKLFRSEGLFVDYGKYQYNDARSRVFAVNSYSSLHESSEGYSKFISQVFFYFDIQSNDFKNICTLHKVLNRLIAEFNLDNKRCFLLLINILSNYLSSHEDLVLEILKKSIWWSKSHEFNVPIQTTIIDYLLNYVGIECKELKLITLLIKEGQLDFHSIYNSLGPLDISIIDSSTIEVFETTEINELLRATQDKIRKESLISTASALALAAPLLPDSDDEDENHKIKKIEKNTVVKEQVSIFDKAKLFRKVNFLEYLMDYEMLDNVLFILVQYPEITLIYDSLADKLNNIIERIITPYYLKNTNNLNLTTKEFIFVSNFESINDLLVEFTKFASFNKYKLSRNSSLLIKLIRILSYLIENNIKDKEFCLQFYRNYIFPCLPFSNNIPLVNEAFDLLSEYYPLETRYNLYGEHQFIVKKDPITKLNYDLAEKKTRDILKRLSIENINISCRTLNKLVSVNPIATSNAFISHIESYNSLIDLVCESSKFFNDFAWDVITYQLLTKLNSNRTPVQVDGLNYNQWFINLSQFIGKLGKLYPESFQLSPILIMIVKSLLNNDLNILEVIKELLDSMTGIKSITNLTTKQIMRLNAEKCLKQLAYMSIQDKREQCSRSSSKLINNLITDKIFAEFFILLCHIPINLINNDNDKPLKFVNQRCDDVTSLIHSLISSFNSNLKNEIFKNNMISVMDLINTYKVQPQWAFEVWRSHFSKDIKDNNNKSGFIFSQEFKDLFMKSLNYINWEKLNISLYLTFWQVSLYDINFNDLSYMMEFSDLKSQLTGINMKLRHENDLSTKEIRSLKDNHKQISNILSYMNHDMQVHEDHYKLILERLNNEKSEWFKDEEIEAQLLLFLKYCVFIRLQHSSFDAVFVSKFIFFLSNIETPNYSLKKVLNYIFILNILPDIFFTNTTLETENLALFYQLILEKLNEWWSRSEIFDKECKGFSNDVKHDEYRKLLYKWHSSLLDQVLKSLESEIYTTRNNAILFLKTILTSFPVIEEHADLLTNKLDKVIETDERDDIKLASRALVGLLKFKQNKYIPIWEFYEMDSEEKEKAMKVKQDKINLKKKHEEEERKKLAEIEKHEREKAAKLNPLLGPSKPYGLIGLGKKKTPEPLKSSDSAGVDKGVYLKKETEKKLPATPTGPKVLSESTKLINDSHSHPQSDSSKPNIAKLNVSPSTISSTSDQKPKKILSNKPLGTPTPPQSLTSTANSTPKAADPRPSKTTTPVLQPSSSASSTGSGTSVKTAPPKTAATTSTTASKTQTTVTEPDRRDSNGGINLLRSGTSSQNQGSIEIIRSRYNNTKGSNNNNNNNNSSSNNKGGKSNWNSYENNNNYYNSKRGNYNKSHQNYYKTSNNNQLDDYRYQNHHKSGPPAPSPPPPPPQQNTSSKGNNQNNQNKRRNNSSSDQSYNNSNSSNTNYKRPRR